MKRSNLIIVAAIAMFVTSLTSCRKELTTSDLQASAGFDENTSGTTTTSSTTKLALRATKPNYGAWILSPYESTDTACYGFVVDVAAELGIASVRDITPIPGTKKVKTLTSQYNVLLNFQGNKTKPMAFRTDISAYQTDLQNSINSLSGKPAVAIIENEESNKGYYSGTAIQYINQLKAAITVMHANGIPVTNGGITSVGLKYLVYQDYLNRGMTTEANDYKKREKIAINNADTKDRADYISILLTNYATMDLDYVNFHWRNSSPADAQGLGETLDYLKRVTGKKIITTEIGQYDQDPATLTSTMDMCKTYGLPFVIWYSGEEDHRSYPLQFGNESLTNTGFSFKDYVSKN